MKESILGVDVSRVTYDSLAEACMRHIDQQENTFIVAVNPEKIMKAKQDDSLRELINSATYQIPDGVGVLIASKLVKGSVHERVTGVDFMLRLCEEAAKKKKNVFLFGGKPGIAEQAEKALLERFPSIRIVGTQDGYEKDQSKVIKKINASKADIVFVAMGSPKQETWILQHMKQCHATVFQGVGGSFDVISGNVKRAPDGFQKIGLEWLYRLLREPWRLKRQLVLPKFLLTAVIHSKKK